jgi:DNA polymerase-3 subunit gamma/tau
MLSTAAFNALLKTLEEPPEHVRFILATTEIRKIPVTVLSRCQKFHLKRVPADILDAHFRAVAEKEGVAISQEASALVAALADGSVRDGLSLLDQAIGRSGTSVDGAVIREMLGLADSARIHALLASAIEGKPAETLKALRSLISDGADPTLLAKDLLEATHLTCLGAIAPEALDDPSISPAERKAAAELGTRIGHARAQNAWQGLAKTIPEMQTSPLQSACLEMALLRLAPPKNKA